MINLKRLQLKKLLKKKPISAKLGKLMMQIVNVYLLVNCANQVLTATEVFKDTKEKSIRMQVFQPHSWKANKMTWMIISSTHLSVGFTKRMLSTH